MAEFVLAIVVVQWFACAFFCIGLAEAKNRNPFVWFVGGLLFGFLALVAAAGMPIRRKRKPPPAPGDTMPVKKW